MATTKGVNLIGLLGGLLDAGGTTDLVTAIRDLQELVTSDHEFVITVQIRHNP